jgi:Phosphoinositide phospholipase C, Ca2+-dependent
MNYFTPRPLLANFLLFFLCIILHTACQTASRQTANERKIPLKINQIQVLGSHNSYKQAIEPALMQLLMATDSSRFIPLDYQHIPLGQQLELGMRKLEIDVVNDPQGGRFAKPLGIELLKQKGMTALPFDEEEKMNAPGFKVLHVQDLDFRSHCLTLTDCLQEIKNWSDAHQKHLPIAISFNAKTDRIDRPGFARPLPFTAAAFDSLDAAIISVFPKERIITPDVVRGNFATLEEAVKGQNWPAIDEARGKVDLLPLTGG